MRAGPVKPGKTELFAFGYTNVSETHTQSLTVMNRRMRMAANNTHMIHTFYSHTEKYAWSRTYKHDYTHTAARNPRRSRTASPGLPLYKKMREGGKHVPNSGDHRDTINVRESVEASQKYSNSDKNKQTPQQASIGTAMHHLKVLKWIPSA